MLVLFIILSNLLHYFSQKDKVLLGSLLGRA
ncbi:CRPV-208 [Crowpox virus]|nr:CRPV-208 [Crowpox virus]